MKNKLTQIPLRAADSVLDRIAVILGALLGAQLPGFISHYRQRLGGHLDEALANQADWQKIADTYFDASLDALVVDYQNNTSPSIVAAGEKAAADLHRVDALQEAVTALGSADAWHLPLVFIQHYDADLALNTLQDYVMNVPTDLAGLSFAALGALLGGMFYHTARGATKRGVRTLSKSPPGRKSRGKAGRKPAVD